MTRCATPTQSVCPKREDVPRSRVAVFERAIDSLAARTIARDELADRDARRLRALIDKKKRVRKDVIRDDPFRQGQR